MPRMEEAHDITRERGSAAKVWAFVQIAMMAAPAPVVRIIRAAVLLGENMFDMKSSQWRGTFGKMTILTPSAGALADELAKGTFHSLSAERLSRARALA